MDRSELAQYLDRYLQVDSFDDASDNGLQVEGAEEVTRVAFAVDACLASFEEAVAAGAQMLIVHHGLFWGRVKRLVGPHYRRVKTLLDGGVSLYACHLPLDAHAEVGNNVELARLLGVVDTQPIGTYRGNTIGVGGSLESPLKLRDLVRRIESRFGPPLRTCDFGKKKVRRVALISGGAVDMVDQVAEAGYDTFVTGEMVHSFYHDIREYGVNVICAGHYASETVGLKALARHLEGTLGLRTVFIDLPTGA